MIRLKENSAFNDSEWSEYFALFRQLQRRYLPREWCADWQAFQNMRLSLKQVYPLRELMIFSEQKPIGWLLLEFREDKAFLDWECKADFPAFSNIAPIIQEVLAFMHQHHTDQIFSETASPFVKHLCTLTHSQIINERAFYEWHRNHENLLTLNHDPYPDEHYSSFRFQVFHDRPDEMLDAYIELYNIAAADIPNADPNQPPQQSWPASELRKLNQSNHKNGIRVFSGIVYNQEQKMVALSDLNINSRAPQRMYQGFTGVHPNFRRKGLARWLKQQLMREVLALFPECQIIDTDSAVLNQAMRKLNESLGFGKTGKGYEYLFEKTALASLLPQ